MVNAAPTLGFPTELRCGDACQEEVDNLFSQNQQRGEDFETLRDRLVIAGRTDLLNKSLARISLRSQAARRARSYLCSIIRVTASTVVTSARLSSEVP